MIFRYSTIADAHSCLRKYYEKHVAKSVPDDTGLDLSFGTGIHLAIKAHYTGSDASRVFKMYWQALESSNLKAGRFNHSQLLELGEKFITRFVSKYSHQFEPIEVERSLQMPMEGQIYSGTLDMLCKYNGLVTLVDWKTSAFQYKLSKLTSSEQIYGYVALAEAEFGIRIEQVMYFVFVKTTGNIQTNIKMKLSREKLDQMVGNIRMMVRDLAVRTEWPMNPNCTRCVCNRDVIEGVENERPESA